MLSRRTTRAAVVATSLSLTAGSAFGTILDDTPGVVYHLDASLGIAQSGGAVSSWTDANGNGQTFTQATAAKQPAFISGATAGNINGLPVIRFDGDVSGSVSGTSPNADELVFNSASSVQTVIIVNRSTTSVGLDGIWGDEGADVGIRRDGSPNGAAGWQHPGNSNTFSFTPGSLYVNGTAGVTSGPAPDGTAHILSSIRSSPLALGDTSIGDYFASGTVSPRSWSGEIAEMAVYNRLLTDPERQAIEAFLGQKYNIAVVPEPGAFGFMALALAGAAIRRRRRSV